METMKAIRIHKYGGPGELQYEEAPRPEPGHGEVLVQVHATSVNPVDWKIREGYLKERLGLRLPMIPGWDFSGTIQEVGPGVRRFKQGDDVFGRPDMGRDGSYAEYIVVRESEIALKPKSIDDVHAAAIPLTGLTAWQALFDTAKLEAGQTVLIHGASGGVGSFAVQLAKWKGAHVIGTASSYNQEFLKDLGVDQAIDYVTQRFEIIVHDVDVVLDTRGGDTQNRSWQVLKKGGILVSIISPPSEEQAKLIGVRCAHVFVQPDSVELEELSKLVDSGKIKPYVETVLPLTEAKRAHEMSQTGHTRGKIVLTIH